MRYESCFLRGDSNSGWKGVLKYKDSAGQWRQKQKSLSAKGKREAQRELESWRAVMEEQAEEERIAAELGYTPGETVAEYVASYIEGRTNHVERSTAAEYRRILSKLIAPVLGDIELDKLTPDAVQIWVNKLAQEFAPVTVRKALVLLRSAMTQAVERDRLTKNPTRTVKAPKMDAPKPNALDERGRAQVVQFLGIDPASPTSIGVALALFLGLREGEVCGLRWRYVDLDAKTLSIEETIGHEGHKWYPKKPKTGGSRRTLHIPDALMPALLTRKTRMNEERMASGLALADLYVTGGADGSFMQPHYLSSKWRTIADALNLIGTQGKRPTFHDLRHTFATAAIAHGVDVKTVSSIMGHANAAMTMNTYASADPDAKKRGAETVAQAMENEAARHAHDGEVLELRKTGTESR